MFDGSVRTTGPTAHVLHVGLTASRVLSDVERATGIRARVILDKCALRRVALARMVAQWLTKELTGATTVELSPVFRRSHHAIAYAHRTISTRIARGEPRTVAMVRRVLEVGRAA